jgi:hypothetical protein
VTSPNNETPATEPTARRTKPATPASVHPRGRATAEAFADPETNPSLVPDLEARCPGGYQDTRYDAPKTKRGWPIETPTWQGVEI